jgi:hypothetical protein
MKTTLRLFVLAMLACALVACSDAKPTEYRIGYVIGGGDGDAHNIKAIVMPGNKIHKERDDTVEFIYGNPRNFKRSTDAGSDEQATWKAQSMPSADGQTPGYGVEGQGIVYFAVNRPPKNIHECDPSSNLSGCKALYAFYSYCQKYGCTLDHDSDNPQDQALSSDQGWMNMLHEGLGNALQHAFTTVMADYDVSVVNEPAEWPKIGAKMAKLVMTEMRSVIGLGKGLDVFCSTTVINTGVCQPIDIRIQSISSPAADSILSARRDQENQTQNQLAQIENQKKVDAANQALEAQRAAADAALYRQPGYAEERKYQAMIDAIKACGPNTQCIVQLNGDAPVQLQVPTK